MVYSQALRRETASSKYQFRTRRFFPASVHLAVIEQVNLFATLAGHVRQEGIEAADTALFFEFFGSLKRT